MKLRTMVCVAVAGLILFGISPADAKKAKQFTLASGETLELAKQKMKGVDGGSVSVADAAGKKGTLVVFTCNACPYVKAWEERIADLGNAYSKKGIGVIAINANDPDRVAADGFEQMKQKAKTRGMSFPYVVDETSKVAKEFGATRTPEVFLFDAKGQLVYHGAVDDNVKDASAVTEKYLEDALDAVLAGEKVQVAETKAIGCTIKWRPGV